MRPYVSHSCAQNGQARSAKEFPASNLPPHLECGPIGHTRQCTPMNAICKGRIRNLLDFSNPRPPCPHMSALIQPAPSPFPWTHQFTLTLLYFTKTKCLFTRGSVSLHSSLFMCVEVSPTLLRFRHLPSFKVSQCNCMSGQQQHPFENPRERYEQGQELYAIRITA